MRAAVAAPGAEARTAPMTLSFDDHRYRHRQDASAMVHRAPLVHRAQGRLDLGRSVAGPAASVPVVDGEAQLSVAGGKLGGIGAREDAGAHRAFGTGGGVLELAELVGDREIANRDRERDREQRHRNRHDGDHADENPASHESNR